MTVDLDALPVPADRRLAVRTTKDALRQIRGGHPWVYAESITSVSHAGSPGDLAVVFDERRRFAGIGLWDPHSPIRLKMVHTGTPVPVDDTFWRLRISEAITRRRTLFDDPDTTGFRVVHGENDRLPGLVVDRFDDVVVVKLYSAAWIPHLRAIVAALRDTLDPRSMVVRLARNLRDVVLHGVAEGDVLVGEAAAEPTLFRENGLTMEAHPVTGQKTGYFLDQRDNRARVRRLSAGADVLDVFCCTGGFSVHAAAGGASTVHGVDIAPGALTTATRTMRRNTEEAGVARCPFRTTAGDAFDVLASLAEAGDRFDLVVVDPPSFASRREDVVRARRAYRRLTSLAVELLHDGGILVQASCSSRVAAADFFTDVREATAGAGRSLTEIERTGHPSDHPIEFAQGAYLKAIFARVGP